MAMQARRRWTPVTATSTGEDRGFGGAPSSGRRAAVATVGSDAPNAPYVSRRALLDGHRTSSRFAPQTSIEAWREKMRRDAAVRAVLLNPVDYEPGES
jgi:hypothetical protein